MRKLGFRIIHIGVVLLVICLFSALVEAGIYYEAKTTSTIQETGREGGTLKTYLKVYIEGQLIRIDSSIFDKQSTIIGNIKENVYYMLTPDIKTYMEIPSQRPSSQMDPGKLRVEVSSQTRLINGYNCRLYNVYYGDQLEMRMWVTNDIDLQEERDTYWSWFEREGFKHLGIKGFPIQTEAVFEQFGSSITTVTKLVKQKIDSSLFEIPADYKKIEMGIWGQQGE